MHPILKLIISVFLLSLILAISIILADKTSETECDCQSNFINK